MASSYRRFLTLCKNWPIDTSKAADKDLAVFIRENIAKTFRHADATRIEEPSKCENIYESLQRISADYHLNKYQLDKPYITASCKATRDECKAVLSKEGSDVIYENDTHILEKVKSKF
ncbi:ubiquinol-cytochrome-c reductase complex assembly factor 2 [Octopus sinensis]|uniref:Mitochondrial nucleoid factor 1 n=1 Tax=Octopus sinensis TaxID=2607531 RepID=A0A6P7TMT6_9MOLL|nr:ubiquinol-cytochrome-c reductase complex assembly factor 2 [Octopus sinensis]